jgi:hypothetical protein
VDINTLLEDRAQDIIAELADDIIELSRHLGASTEMLSFVVEQLVSDMIAHDDPANAIRLALSSVFEESKPILLESEDGSSRRWVVIERNFPLDMSPLIEAANDDHHVHLVFERGAWGSREFVHRQISARNRGSNFGARVSDRDIDDHPITREARKRGWTLAAKFHANGARDMAANSAAKEHIEHGRYMDNKINKMPPPKHK